MNIEEFMHGNFSSLDPDVAAAHGVLLRLLS